MVSSPSKLLARCLRSMASRLAWQGGQRGGCESQRCNCGDDRRHLVEAGIWEPVKGGWQIHDYLEYQPSKEEIQSLSNKRRENGRRGGLAKSVQIAKQNESNVPSKSSGKSPSKTEAKSYPVPDPLSVSSLRSDTADEDN